MLVTQIQMIPRKQANNHMLLESDYKTSKARKTTP
uniref:Uncharacterized protein n=1 Tax=Oryza nivara TaxID=4536 RepID=A0A0E0GEE1_ORYNI